MNLDTSTTYDMCYFVRFLVLVMYSLTTIIQLILNMFIMQYMSIKSS